MKEVHKATQYSCGNPALVDRYIGNLCYSQNFFIAKMGRDLRATVEETHRDRQPSRRRRRNAADLWRRHIEEAIAEIGLPDLVVPVKEPQQQLLVDFAVLNRMRVAGLQNDLAAKVQEIDNGAEESSSDNFSAIDGLLERYCTSKGIPTS